MGRERPAGAWPLVGRDEELRLLTRAVHDGPGSVVVVGAAGVGKSRLVADFLEATAAPAATAAAGWRTVLVRGTRSTATIPFGPFVAWCPSDPGEPSSTDRLQVLREVVTALLDGDGPLVVAVDDAHLLDEASAALVLHLAAQTPARVVATVRADERCPDAVVALWKEALAERIDLAPLAEAHVAELVGRVLDGPLHPSVLQRVWGITAGAPLYVREVLHAARDQGVLTRCAGAWQWQGELAGTCRLTELLLGRVAHLGRRDRRALDLVAVGEPLPVGVADELGCLGVVAELEHEGLVAVSDGGGGGEGGAGFDDGDVVRLAHPLYGELLRACMPRLAARQHHGDLARAAVAVGWHRHDPLRVAAWCAESGGVPGPADVFVLAARRALTIGEWGLATRHAEAAEAAESAAAAEATGAAVEATLVKAAALVHLGGWGEVGPLLDEVPAGPLDDRMLAEHARLWAGYLSWSKGDIHSGRDVLMRTAAELDATARARARTGAAHITLLAGDLDGAVRLATAAMDDAGSSTDVRVAAMALAAAALVLQGRARPALRIAEAGAPHVGDAVTADPYPDNPAGVFAAAHCLALVLDGRLDEAGALAGAALAPFASSRVDTRLTVTATMAARIALLRGQLVEARRWAGEALRNAGPGPGSQWPAAVVATAAAQQGDRATARAALDHAAATTPAIPLIAHELTLARAWVQVADGDLGAARRTAARAATGAAEAGAAVFELLAWLDLARLGDATAASPRLTELAHVVEGPFAAACAAYARAAAGSDGDALDRVAAELEGMGAVLVAAEAAAAAAAAHRQAGSRRRDRASRARARAFAARCPGAGTPALHELGADPGPARLTRREREVAALVARDLTNRQIAERLHVSIRTVNSHLGHVYAKLGTSDRAQLADLVPATPA